MYYEDHPTHVHQSECYCIYDLCSMRDDDFCKMFNKTQLDQLIIDISIWYGNNLFDITEKHNTLL